MDGVEGEACDLEDHRLISLALRTAAKSPHPHHRHASVVLKGGAVLATGYNHDERHSEVVALSKLWPSKRRGTVVLNLRLTNAGSVALARPCVECAEFLRRSGVQYVWWTTREGLEGERL